MATTEETKAVQDDITTITATMISQEEGKKVDLAEEDPDEHDKD